MGLAEKVGKGLAEKVGKGLAKGWRRVGEGLAKGWQRVGEGLAKGWRRVGKGLAGFLAPSNFAIREAPVEKTWFVTPWGMVLDKPFLRFTKTTDF